MNRYRSRITAFFVLVLFATQPIASLIQTTDLAIEGRVSTVDHQHCEDSQPPINLEVNFDTDQESTTCSEYCQDCVGSCCVVFCSSKLGAIPASLVVVFVNYTSLSAKGLMEILFRPPRLA